MSWLDEWRKRQTALEGATHVISVHDLGQSPLTTRQELEFFALYLGGVSMDSSLHRFCFTSAEHAKAFADSLKALDLKPEEEFLAYA
ncbi:hypothetical protein [Pseudanabaena sp. PCC 6802]|uniref:hypothetical protein n=1 Tax=Pseudanabaena sp. PCC 6802 TaxID=118173 RepID=UPI00034DA219|nr:hypothetical protein [Pseudanabaena sp. PCC 6802]